MTACLTTCGEATVDLERLEELFPFGHFSKFCSFDTSTAVAFGFPSVPRIYLESKIDHKYACAMRNTMEVQTGTLTKRRILSVPCPVCRAKPKEKCTLSTGHPSDKTHLDRGLAAAKAPPPEGSVLAALRSLGTLTGHGLRALFHHK